VGAPERTEGQGEKAKLNRHLENGTVGGTKKKDEVRREA